MMPIKARVNQTDTTIFEVEVERKEEGGLRMLITTADLESWMVDTPFPFVFAADDHILSCTISSIIYVESDISGLFTIGAEAKVHQDGTSATVRRYRKEQYEGK